MAFSVSLLIMMNPRKAQASFNLWKTVALLIKLLLVLVLHQANPMLFSVTGMFLKSLEEPTVSILAKLLAIFPILLEPVRTGLLKAKTFCMDKLRLKVSSRKVSQLSLIPEAVPLVFLPNISMTWKSRGKRMLVKSIVTKAISVES